MDELHEQTINLLNFQQMPTGVFDVQVAFNMIDVTAESSIRGSGGAKDLQSSAPAIGNSCRHAAVCCCKHRYSMHTLFHLYRVGQECLHRDFARRWPVSTCSCAKPEDSPSNVNVAGRDEIWLRAG